MLVIRARLRPSSPEPTSASDVRLGHPCAFAQPGYNPRNRRGTMRTGSAWRAFRISRKTRLRSSSTTALRSWLVSKLAPHGARFFAREYEPSDLQFVESVVEIEVGAALSAQPIIRSCPRTAHRTGCRTPACLPSPLPTVGIASRCASILCRGAQWALLLGIALARAI